MENEIEVGNVVHLNSGGPDMTVMEVDSYNHVVTTIWFDNHGCLQRGIFSDRTLHLADYCNGEEEPEVATGNAAN